MLGTAEVGVCAVLYRPGTSCKVFGDRLSTPYRTFTINSATQAACKNCTTSRQSQVYSISPFLQSLCQLFILRINA